jgi:hypothetical protein
MSFYLIPSFSHICNMISLVEAEIRHSLRRQLLGESAFQQTPKRFKGKSSNFNAKSAVILVLPAYVKQELDKIYQLVTVLVTRD